MESKSKPGGDIERMLLKLDAEEAVATARRRREMAAMLQQAT